MGENPLNTPLNTKKIYFPELDGLRFIAFLLVFTHHAPAIPINPILISLDQYGWFGVDLFFCLSAFLFVKLLYAEYRKTNTINIKYFYIRRGLRIWPLYFVFIIAMILWSFLKTGVPNAAIIRIVGLFTFTDDIITSILSYNGIILFTTHLWTISYEEQFYAIIPWFLRKIFRMSDRSKVITFICIIFIGNLIRGFMLWKKIPHPAVWVLPISHFDSILVGLVLGVGLIDPLLKKIPRIVIFLLGIAALVGVCNLPNVDSLSYSLMLTYPLVGIGMGLILFSVISESQPQPFLLRWLSNKAIVFLGKISFGLYVFHYGVLFLTQAYLKADISNLPLYILYVYFVPLAATILIASISYIVLEKPFLRLKERFTIIKSRAA